MKSSIMLLFAFFVLLGTASAQYKSSQIKLNGLGTASPTGPDLVVSYLKVRDVPESARRYTGNVIKLPIYMKVRNKGPYEARSIARGIPVTIQVDGGTQIQLEKYARFPANSTKVVTGYVYVPVSAMGKTIKITAAIDPPYYKGSSSVGHAHESINNNNSKVISYRVPKYRPINPKTNNL